MIAHLEPDILECKVKWALGSITMNKISGITGKVHARMATRKDRNSMDLTEAEDIKKKWQEYSEECYKKDLNDPDNHDGVITHLEPEILECKILGLRKHHYKQS